MGRYSKLGRFNNLKLLGFLAAVGIFLMCACPGHAIEQPEKVLDQDVGVFTKLGERVDIERTFTDRTGLKGPLSSFMLPHKPTIIVPVYYKCPRLCGLLLNGVADLLNQLTLSLGKDFTVLAVSFDPRESPTDAENAWVKFNERLIEDAAGGRESFRFLVGSVEDVAGLMGELGFRYLPDGEDFAHSAALMILTPTGEISQYFTGIEFSPWDVRLALVEASHGKIGSAMDHLLLYCFRFDPLQGKYTWAVVATLRIGGALTLIGLALVYFFYARKRDRSHPNTA